MPQMPRDRMTLARIACPCALACALLAVAGCSAQDEGQHVADVAEGARVYAAHCASCHGENMEGEPDWRTRKPDGRLPAPPHDASGHTWHHSMDMLFRMTRDGIVPPLAPDGYESDMPAFGGVLSDNEIRAVLSYIESRWPNEIQHTRAQRFAPPAR